MENMKNHSYMKASGASWPFCMFFMPTVYICPVRCLYELKGEKSDTDKNRDDTDPIKYGGVLIPV